MMMRTSMWAVAAAVATMGATAPAVAAPAAGLSALLASPWRAESNKVRDTARHPAETLTFFGIKPTMTVVEIWPSGGYYTEILAPYLRGKGHYYAAGSDPSAGAGAVKNVARLAAKLAATPAAYDKAVVTKFGKGAYDIAPPGSADMVVSFRNVHNWEMDGFAPDAFKAFYKVLKPGGILGIEEHRLPEGKPDALMQSSGYMKVSRVRALAEAAGFKYVGSSEINANPRDTKDYAQGVWTLPPTFAEGDKDRAKYAAIGESDRMTLKFVKK